MNKTEFVAKTQKSTQDIGKDAILRRINHMISQELFYSKNARSDKQYNLALGARNALIELKYWIEEY